MSAENVIYHFPVYHIGSHCGAASLSLLLGRWPGRYRIIVQHCPLAAIPEPLGRVVFFFFKSW